MIHTLKLNTLFWKLCLLSGIVHSALFGLPWPQKPLIQESETIADEALIPGSSAGISITTLPANSLNPSRSAKNSPLSTTDPSSQVLDAAELQPPQPAAAQPQAMLPTDSLTESQLVHQQTQYPIQTIDPSQTVLDTQEDPFQPLGTEPAGNLPGDGPVTKALLSDSAEHGTVVALDETFPHLEGAQSGCYGLTGCQQVRGNFRRAAEQLIDQMESKGYQLAELDDIDVTGHRIFEVTVPDEPDTTYFLNVFSSDSGSTIYVMALDILSLAELQQLSS